MIAQAFKRNNLKYYPALITLGLLGRRVVLQDPGVHQTLQGMHFSISTFYEFVFSCTFVSSHLVQRDPLIGIFPQQLGDQVSCALGHVRGEPGEQEH